MKKITKELIFIIVISFIICIVNIQKVDASENDGVEEPLETSVVKLTSYYRDTDTYYDHLDVAIEDATYNDTITLLKDVNEDGYENSGESVIEISEGITFELGTYTIHSRGFKITNWIYVNFNADISGGMQGGIVTGKSNVHTFDLERGYLTLSNIKITDNVNTGDFATILVQSGYLDIEDNTNITTVSNAIENQNDVSIYNVGHLQSTGGYAIYLKDDADLEIDAGNIEGKKGAIYVDKDSSDSYIDIYGGKIKSTSGAGVALNNGYFYMNGGTIEGIIGIVLNGGSGNIYTGTVNGTGSGTGKIAGIDSTSDLELGTSIMISAFPDDGYTGREEEIINLAYGTYNATGSSSLYSSLSDGISFMVEGGTFSKPFDMKYAREGRLMLHITKEGSETWYLGTAAKSAIGPNKKIAGAEIEVLQGDLTITDGIDGLKVKNSGVGKVVANNKEVAQGSEITIGQTSGNSNSSGTDTTDTTDTTNDSQTDGTGSGLTKISPADSTVAGKKLPRTGDLRTILLVIGALIASLSIVITYLKIRRAEGK